MFNQSLVQRRVFIPSAMRAYFSYVRAIGVSIPTVKGYRAHNKCVYRLYCLVQPII